MCPACHRPGGVVGGRSRRRPAYELVVCTTCGAICYLDAGGRLRVLLVDIAALVEPDQLLEAIGISNAIQTPCRTRH